MLKGLEGKLGEDDYSEPLEILINSANKNNKFNLFGAFAFKNQLKDRLKDIIISGGENISSIEIEGALHRHPSVAIAAVIAKPHEKWGEVPCAFVELKPDAKLTEGELIEFSKQHLASFKRPKEIIFLSLIHI